MPIGLSQEYETDQVPVKIYQPRDTQRNRHTIELVPSIAAEINDTAAGKTFIVEKSESDRVQLRSVGIYGVCLVLYY